MKIAAAQLMSGPDKTANLLKAVQYIGRAKNQGADLILLPELFMAHVPPEAGARPAAAEPIDGPFVSGLAEAARANQIYVVCGVLETAPHDAARAYNTVVALDRAGRLCGSYRKTHLYDAFSHRESATVAAGDNAFLAIETEWGKMGVFVCYELRFPEISRRLILDGATVLLMPTAWVAGAMKEEQMEILVRARAIENTAYVCAADQIGNGYAGRSLIADPMGVILAGAGEEERLIMADIEPERVARVREKLPCLQHRRPELY